MPAAQLPHCLAFSLPPCLPYVLPLLLVPRPLFSVKTVTGRLSVLIPNIREAAPAGGALKEEGFPALTRAIRSLCRALTRLCITARPAQISPMCPQLLESRDGLLRPRPAPRSERTHGGAPVPPTELSGGRTWKPSQREQLGAATTPRPGHCWPWCLSDGSPPRPQGGSEANCPHRDPLWLRKS